MADKFYWSAKLWDMQVAPARPDASYRRLPTSLFVVLAPLMGALYVVFLPVAGFVMAGRELWSRGKSALAYPVIQSR